MYVECIVEKVYGAAIEQLLLVLLKINSWENNYKNYCLLTNVFYIWEKAAGLLLNIHYIFTFYFVHINNWTVEMNSWNVKLVCYRFLSMISTYNIILAKSIVISKFVSEYFN